MNTASNNRRRFLHAAGATLVLNSLPRAARAAGAPAGRMKIGIVGSGRVGGTLGRVWANAGHEVMFSSIDLEHDKKLAADSGKIAGQKIRDLVTVNGIRVTLEDGTWGLVRASSNKPELVVVVESPTSEANMKAIFADIDALLSRFPEVGAYNQKIVA